MESKQLAIAPDKVNWLEATVYYVVACAFSWPFFWWRDMEPESWQSWQLTPILKNWCIMWGPGISACLCFFIFRRGHVRTVTFFGTSVKKSLLFYFLPFLALAIPGVDGRGEVNAHLMPLLISLLGFISILGEELGWRGFLQDSLRPLSQVKRYVLIGVLWEFWHFTNRMGHGTLSMIVIKVGIFLVVTIGLSFLIGKAVDKSRSLIIAVTFHAWIDIIFDYNSLWPYVVFGLSVPFWIYMLLNWDKKAEEAVPV